MTACPAPHRTRLRLAAKINDEYGNAKTLPAALIAQQKGGAGPARPNSTTATSNGTAAQSSQQKLIQGESLFPVLSIHRGNSCPSRVPRPSIFNQSNYRFIGLDEDEWRRWWSCPSPSLARYTHATLTVIDPSKGSPSS